MPTDVADVIVIGAGAAGLAAAHHLAAAGLRVLILEARARPGGRILTHRHPESPRPVELGAEFLHGPAEETRALIAEGGLRTVDVPGRRWQHTAAGLRPLDDFWQRLHRVMRYLPDGTRPDESFAGFLERAPGGRGAERDRRLARQFVEGFQAADPDVISARSLATGSDPSDAPDDQALGRVFDGYDRVIDVLARPLARRIRYRAVVETVRWDHGRAEVVARIGVSRRTRTYRAAAVVVTVPAAVLRADGGDGAIRFVPTVPGKAEALAGLATGAVLRVVVECREAFWTSSARTARSAGSLESMSFLHADRIEFPTWWTAYPERAPVLVAWRGGPGAAALASAPAGIPAAVVASMAAVFGLTRKRAGRSIARLHWHDWQSDPYARGGYSYEVVGSRDAPEALAQPVAATLFFAGEATASDGRIGTVDGALASGARAAREVVGALRRRVRPRRSMG